MKPKIIQKISNGFVTQRWENGKFVGQTFTTGTECDLEDDKGNALDLELEPEYQPYPMIKEETRIFVKQILEVIVDEIDSFRVFGQKLKKKKLEDALNDLK